MTVATGRGLVLLLRRCDTLYGSGFVDDVILGPMARNPKEKISVTAETTVSIATNFQLSDKDQLLILIVSCTLVRNLRCSLFLNEIVKEKERIMKLSGPLTELVTSNRLTPARCHESDNYAHREGYDYEVSYLSWVGLCQTSLPVLSFDSIAIPDWEVAALRENRKSSISRTQISCKGKNRHYWHFHPMLTGVDEIAYGRERAGDATDGISWSC